MMSTEVGSIRPLTSVEKVPPPFTRSSLPVNGVGRRALEVGWLVAEGEGVRPVIRARFYIDDVTHATGDLGRLTVQDADGPARGRSPGTCGNSPISDM